MELSIICTWPSCALVTASTTARRHATPRRSRSARAGRSCGAGRACPWQKGFDDAPLEVGQIVAHDPSSDVSKLESLFASPRYDYLGTRPRVSVDFGHE